MTTDDKEQQTVNRRSFLRGLGLGAAGAAGAAALAVNGAGAPAEAKPAEAKPSIGYRETEHVKRAYGAARF